MTEIFNHSVIQKNVHYKDVENGNIRIFSFDKIASNF